LRNLNSFISIQYAFGDSEQELPEGEQVTYDMAIPGVILLNSDPTSQGGLNFSDAMMTKNKNDTDIAIYGEDIGSRGIIDLGEVNMNEVNFDSIPDSGFSKFADLKAGHVYISTTHDGDFVKFYVVGVYSSTVELVYQMMEEGDDDDGDDGTFSVLESIELIGPDSIGSDPVTLTLIGTLDNGETVEIPNEEVTWETSDEDVGTITAEGEFQITGKPGEVTISASYDDMVSEITYTVISLTSLKINQSFKYSPTPKTLTVTAGYSDKSSVLVKTGVTWKSNNTKVATVTSKGVVTFTGNSGKVTITASYNGKTASVTTTVGNVVKSLTTTTKLAYNKKPVTIALTATYSDGKKVKLTKGVVWKSTNTKVAKVSSNGVVTFTGQNGEVTITATYQGKTLSLKTTVFLKENELKFFTSKSWKLYMDYVQLYVGTLKLNSNGTYTWSHPTRGKITGKWEMNKNYTISLYKFGYNLDKTYAMYRNKEGGVELTYNGGETGSDFYIGK
jgi:putative transposon-encoded protein